MKYGYARVSSVGQDLTIQVQSLKDAGCYIIREEKVSGTSLKGRNELNTLIEFMRDGDLAAIMRAGGWSNAETVSRYLRFSQHNIWK